MTEQLLPTESRQTNPRPAGIQLREQKEARSPQDRERVLELRRRRTQQAKDGSNREPYSKLIEARTDSPAAPVPPLSVLPDPVSTLPAGMVVAPPLVVLEAPKPSTTAEGGIVAAWDRVRRGSYITALRASSSRGEVSLWHFYSRYSNLYRDDSRTDPCLRMMTPAPSDMDSTRFAIELGVVDTMGLSALNLGALHHAVSCAVKDLGIHPDAPSFVQLSDLFDLNLLGKANQTGVVVAGDVDSADLRMIRRKVEVHLRQMPPSFMEAYCAALIVSHNIPKGQVPVCNDPPTLPPALVEFLNKSQVSCGMPKGFTPGIVLTGRRLQLHSQDNVKGSIMATKFLLNCSYAARRDRSEACGVSGTLAKLAGIMALFRPLIALTTLSRTGDSNVPLMHHGAGAGISISDGVAIVNSLTTRNLDIPKEDLPSVNLTRWVKSTYSADGIEGDPQERPGYLHAVLQVPGSSDLGPDLKDIPGCITALVSSLCVPELRGGKVWKERTTDSLAPLFALLKSLAENPAICGIRALLEHNLSEIFVQVSNANQKFLEKEDACALQRHAGSLLNCDYTLPGYPNGHPLYSVLESKLKDANTPRTPGSTFLKDKVMSQEEGWYESILDMPLHCMDTHSLLDSFQSKYRNLAEEDPEFVSKFEEAKWHAGKLSYLVYLIGLSKTFALMVNVQTSTIVRGGGLGAQHASMTREVLTSIYSSVMDIKDAAVCRANFWANSFCGPVHEAASMGMRPETGTASDLRHDTTVVLSAVMAEYQSLHSKLFRSGPSPLPDDWDLIPCPGNGRG
jgi:hypothetical protein